MSLTGYIGYAVMASGEDPAGILVEWNNAFAWILYMVFAYFMVYMPYKAFKLWKTN